MKNILIAVVLVAASVLTGCETDSGPADNMTDLTVDLAVPKSGYQMKTPPSIVPAGEEVHLCVVVKLDLGAEYDGKLMWIDEAESLVSEGSHHMNVLFGEFSFYDAFLGDGSAENVLGVTEGVHDCDDLGAFMEKALPVFPSQRVSQKITFPEGTGLPTTNKMVLIFNHHYLNLTEKPIKIDAALNFHVVPESEIDIPVSLIIDDSRGEISVPANAQNVFARTCVLDREMDRKVALVSTHNP